MKILLDQNIPRKLRRFLKGHLAVAAESAGWDRLQNGDLLRSAELNGFALMITADQSIRYQQNNRLRTVALLVLDRNHWEILAQNIEPILAAVERTVPGGYEELNLRNKPSPER